MPSINIPCPAANGVGASTDVSALGLTKTIVANNVGQCTVNLEINNASDAATGSWAPLMTFRMGGTITVPCAARWVRARVSGYQSGTPEVNISASDAGTSFVNLPIDETAVATSSLPSSKTVQVGGQFTGVINIEISTDGNTDWAQIVSFKGPGQKFIVASATFMRVNGVVASGSPVVNVGAADDASGGGGGSIAITVDGVAVGDATTLNFGEGTVATDDGGGVVTVTATPALFPIEPGVNTDAEVDAKLFFVILAATTLNNVEVLLPPAASVPNGAWCGFFRTAGDPGESNVSFTTQGGDTYRGNNTTTSNNTGKVAVSDGVSTWTLLFET